MVPPKLLLKSDTHLLAHILLAKKVLCLSLMAKGQEVFSSHRKLMQVTWQWGWMYIPSTVRAANKGGNNITYSSGTGTNRIHAITMKHSTCK